MLVKIHVLLSLFFLLFYKEYRVYVLFAILSSVLIDFDHYLVYVFRRKDFCLRKAIKYHVETERTDMPFVFHSVYFLGFVFLLSYIFRGYMVYGLDLGMVFLFVFYGMIYHVFFDVVYALLVLFVPELAYKVGVKKKYSRDEVLEKLSMRLFLSKKVLGKKRKD